MCDTKPLIRCDQQIIEPEINIFLELLYKSPFENYQNVIVDLDITTVFWVYYIIKKYRPSLIIQNNLTNPVSDSIISWFITILCPDTQIIYVDNDFDKKPHIDMNIMSTYRLTTFEQNDWIHEFGIEKCNNTLILSFAHYNHLDIIRHAYNNHIRHIIFPDNYPTIQGDHLTIKKILSNKYHISSNGVETTFYYIQKEHKANLDKMCDCFEFPPIYLDTHITRWGDAFNDHICKPSIITNYTHKLLPFKDYQLNYTFPCFVKINI